MSKLVSRAITAHFGGPYIIATAALLNNFNTAELLTYGEIVGKAGRQRRLARPTETDKEHILFTDINIKQFGVPELKSLLRLDTTKSSVKFRLTTNNQHLLAESIDPNFRRLLNNGLNYGIYMNSPSQTQSLLVSKETKYIPRKTQTTVMISKKEDRYVTKEVSTAKSYSNKIGIEINGSPYVLSTPSIPILTRLYAIGVPSNHPELLSLVNTTFKSPITGLDLPIIEVPESETLDLIAIVPKHILDHQVYHKVTPSSASEPFFPYQNKFRPVEEITPIICDILKVPIPLFVPVPYISESLYDPETDIKITRTVNNKYVLEEKSFDKIETSEPPFFLKKNRKFDDWSPKTIREIINGEPIFRENVRITPDILRSVLLEDYHMGGALYKDRRDAVELLTLCLGIFKRDYFDIAQVSYNPYLVELLEKDEREVANEIDYYILDQFYKLHETDGNKIGDFIIALANYLNYNELQKRIGESTSHRNDFISNLISNILIRLFNDHLRFHFPELSFFFYHNIFKFNEIQIQEFTDHSNANQWQNYLKYPIEVVPEFRGESHSHFEVIPTLYTIISSTRAFPEPFNYHVCINTSQASIVNRSDVLNKITNQLPAITSNILFNHYGESSSKDLSAKGVFRFTNTAIKCGEGLTVSLVRLLGPNHIKAWVKHYHQVQPSLRKLESLKTLQDLTMHFKSQLKNDVYLNYGLNPETDRYDIKQLLRLIDIFVDKYLQPLGLEEFKKLYLEVRAKELSNTPNLGQDLQSTDETEFDKVPLVHDIRNSK